MRSAEALKGQPKLVRERSQQTCEAGARQHTIASGSYCCRALRDSRNCPGFRTVSLGATARAQADRHDLGKARSAQARESCSL